MHDRRRGATAEIDRIRGSPAWCEAGQNRPARATSSTWTKSRVSSPSSKIGNDRPSRIRVEKIDRGAGVGVLQRIPFAIDVLETQHGRLNAQCASVYAQQIRLRQLARGVDRRRRQLVIFVLAQWHQGGAAAQAVRRPVMASEMIRAAGRREVAPLARRRSYRRYRNDRRLHHKPNGWSQPPVPSRQGCGWPECIT